MSKQDERELKEGVAQNPNVFRSLVVAWNGIRLLFRTQRNARIHAVGGSLLIISNLFLPLTPVEWGVLLLCIGLVLTLETVNTAIEITVNLVTRERHPLAGQAKDVAAGAVLLGVFCALSCWAVICIPKYWAFFQ